MNNPIAYEVYVQQQKTKSIQDWHSDDFGSNYESRHPEKNKREKVISLSQNAFACSWCGQVFAASASPTAVGPQLV